jgi:hypothetical protein
LKEEKEKEKNCRNKTPNGPRGPKLNDCQKKKNGFPNVKDVKIMKMI